MDVVYYYLAGLLLMAVLLVIMIFSLPLLGFWARYIRIRLTGGGLILVKWRGKTDHYYKLGKLGKLELKVTKRYAKQATVLTLPKNESVFYRMLNIIVVDIDEETNGFLKPDYTGIEGFDEETYENIVIRALMSEGVVPWKMILIGLGLVLVACIVILFVLRLRVGQLSEEHVNLSQTVVQAVKSTCVPVL